MKQSVEHGGDGGGVAEQLAPVFDRSVGREQRAGAFVAAHDDLEEFFGGSRREFAHSEIIDDEQRNSGKQFHVFFACAIEGGVGDFAEQGVGLAIEHAIALLDCRQADGLGQMTLAGAGWAEKQGVFVAGNEVGGGEIEDQTAIHLLVEAEIEVVERLVQVAKACGFFAGVPAAGRHDG